MKVIKEGDDKNDGTGFGYADYSNRIENKESNVLYPSASLQKVATGAMMVQLITESQK